MKTASLQTNLTGMICPQCEDEILTALLHTRGIISADVSYRKASARITYDADLVTGEQITEVLRETGYPPGNGGKAAIVSDVISAAVVVGLFFAVPAVMKFVPSVSAENMVGLWSVFLIGLISGVHCIGMCGGIMLTQHSVVRYNLSRVLGCTVAGLIFGTLGRAMHYDAETGSMLKTLCGAAVVLVGLKQWGVPVLRRLSISLRPVCKTPGRTPIVVGFLNAFMPCGALSTMWLVSAASGSALHGAETGLCFALGTCPAMMLFGSFERLVPKKYNKYILRGGTVLILALGLRMLYTGIAG